MEKKVLRKIHPEIWVQEIPLFIRVKEDPQCICAETVTWRANGSMENMHKGQSTKIPLVKNSNNLTLMVEDRSCHTDL